MFLFLFLLFFFTSVFKGSCDYIDPTKIIHDNFPILRSADVVYLHLQSSSCHISNMTTGVTLDSKGHGAKILPLNAIILYFIYNEET